MAINRKRDVIKRQGKDMLLFTGLVNEAHEAGLCEIQSKLVYAPDQSNGTVIFWARVSLQDSESENRLHVESHGDANQSNVSAQVAPSYIRMAETRAIARALRIALNVTELMEGDAHDETLRQAGETAIARREAIRAPATKDQLDIFADTLTKKGLVTDATPFPDLIVQKYGRTPDQLTFAEVEAAIAKLREAVK